MNLSSCSSKNNSLDDKSLSIENSSNYCDSVFYSLSDSAANKMKYLIGENDNIRYISLLSNSSENEYHFSISSNELYKLGDVNNFNRFLKVANKRYPLLIHEDLIFANKIIRKSVIKHFNSNGITVNSKGESIDSW